ncbi:MAG: glycosyltransferase [Fuerstiella sp.]|nr:glycosyltransferase [Fuerstiella sp.]
MAHYYPPIGGAGTARSDAFVRYLPEYAVNPVVFSVEPVAEEAHREFQLDHSLLLDDNGVDVIRVSGRDRLAGLRQLLLRTRLYPIYWALAYRWEYEGCRSWARNAGRTVAHQHARSPFDLIYATAGPNSTLEAAAKAARTCGIPWVADLRDPWNVASLKRYPSLWHYRWEKNFERRLLLSADAVVMNTPGAYRLMRDWLGRDASGKITWIPNGFDARHVSTSSAIHGAQNRSPRCQIIHTGTLYTPGMRASRPGNFYTGDIDDTARSLVPLAQSVRQLLDRRPELAQRLEIIQIGHAPEKLMQVVREIVPETGVFQFLGVQPRHAVLKAMREADVLLVVQVAWADRNRNVPHIPGKVYDYLPLHKPILAFVPAGDLKNLLLRIPQAAVIDYKNVSEGARRLEQMADGLFSIDDTCTPVDQSKLTRQFQAGILAEIFRRVTTGKSCEGLAKADFE